MAPSIIMRASSTLDKNESTFIEFITMSKAPHADCASCPSKPFSINKREAALLWFVTLSEILRMRLSRSPSWSVGRAMAVSKTFATIGA